MKKWETVVFVFTPPSFFWSQTPCSCFFLSTAGPVLAMFLAFGTLFALFVKRHDFPANFYLLAAFVSGFTAKHKS